MIGIFLPQWLFLNSCLKCLKLNPSYLLVSELLPTWRHSCNSWGLQSELPAVRLHTDRPPSPLQWAIGLSFQYLCCGWWTRPSEPKAETAANTGVNLCSQHNLIEKTFTGGRPCHCNMSQKRYFSGGMSSHDLRPQLWHPDLLLARQHYMLRFYIWKLGTGMKEHYPFIHLVSKDPKCISPQLKLKNALQRKLWKLKK